MPETSFDYLTRAASEGIPSRPRGWIASIERGVVVAKGFGARAAIGDMVRIGSAGRGEITGADAEGFTIIPELRIEGLSPGMPVTLQGAEDIRPDDSWLGRIVDPSGRPLDGRALLPGPRPMPIFSAPPDAAARNALGGRLDTGFCAFNTLLPLVRGQRIGLFAGSGVGKSTLLGHLATRVEADVVVIGLVGERGRELRHFVEEVLGPEAMARAVVVAATSDQSASMRRKCAASATTVAEHFRDQGVHVLLLVDSVTRFADAHREVALSRGESPAMNGYPASLLPGITGLCERAGPGAKGSGDITAIYTVLVAGSDMEGPVADILRGTLDGHVVLDRGIAERGRFPAINMLRSVSRSLPGAANERENLLIGEARRLLGAYERSEMMIRAGLYSAGTDKVLDAAIEAWPKLDAFIGAMEETSIQENFVSLARCLRRGGAATG